MRRWKLLFLLVVFLSAGVMLVFGRMRSGTDLPRFELARVERGPIQSTVTATGTLNPVGTVKVGSQVSGQITEILVDFNSEVHSNQVIAKIAQESFEARLRQTEAEVAVAEANVSIQRASVRRAQAELENARAALASIRAQKEKAKVAEADARRDLDRKKVLFRRSVISQHELDRATAAHDQAVAQLKSLEAEEEARASLVSSREAQLKMAEAQVLHALARLKQRKAQYYQAKIDLEHTIIRAPVDGLIIDRSVDVGQTVAASLQAPTLFTIAKDLRRMEVDTSLDEADVGRIRVGQKASFTVDAYPGREFFGRVEQIRKAPIKVQNVVTYTVVVSAENPDLMLFPGMTANVRIIIDERRRALKVPNRALRFRPPEALRLHSKASSVRISKKEGTAGIDRRLERLSRALSLDEDQRRSLRAIFSKGRRRISELRQQGASQEQISSQISLLRREGRKAILEILRPEQRSLFMELVSRRWEKRIKPATVWVLGKDGYPQSVPLMVGISDGGFTEVLEGDLQDGQEVIVGIALRALNGPSGQGS